MDLQLRFNNPSAKDPNTISTRAAQQQMALLTFMYAGRQDYLEEWFQTTPDDRILVYHYQPKDLAPSWYVGKTDNAYFIGFCGTVNSDQMIGNFLGYTAVDYYLDPSVKAHFFWQDAFTSLRAELEAALGPHDPSKTYFVTGHSYGAAVAQFCAFHLAKKRDPAAVQLMNFGTPRSLSSGYRGPFPQRMYRVYTEADIVHGLPPSEGVISLGTRAVVNREISLPIDWTSYGFPVRIAPNGLIYLVERSELKGMAHLVADPRGAFTSHLTSEYNLRLRRAVQRYVGYSDSVGPFDLVKQAEKEGGIFGDDVSIADSAVLSAAQAARVYFNAAAATVGLVEVTDATTVCIMIGNIDVP